MRLLSALGGVVCASLVVSLPALADPVKEVVVVNPEPLQVEVDSTVDITGSVDVEFPDDAEVSVSNVVDVIGSVDVVNSPGDDLDVHVTNDALPVANSPGGVLDVAVSGGPLEVTVVNQPTGGSGEYVTAYFQENHYSTASIIHLHDWLYEDGTPVPDDAIIDVETFNVTIADDDGHPSYWIQFGSWNSSSELIRSRTFAAGYAGEDSFSSFYTGSSDLPLRMGNNIAGEVPIFGAAPALTDALLIIQLTGRVVGYAPNP